MAKIYSQHCVAKPVNLALDLKDAKEFLRVNYDEDDQLLTNMIISASEKFQKYTSRALIAQNWEISYRQLGRISLTLPIKPVIKILSTKLVDSNGKETEYNINHIDLDAEASEIVFNVFPQAYIVKVTYKAGYGLTPESIPQDIKTLLLTHVAYMYENRSIATHFPLSSYDEFKMMRF